jgi:hypothetical protein
LGDEDDHDSRFAPVLARGGGGVSGRGGNIVTRDSKPVAKLVRVTQAEAQGPRWTTEAQRKWIKKVYGKKVFPSSDERLAAARADRKLT